MQEKSLWILKLFHVLLAFLLDSACTAISLSFPWHFSPYTLQRENKSPKDNSKNLFWKSSIKLIPFIPMIKIIV